MRWTKEEKAAMRAARLEGQGRESLAVALQGKRPQPPTPSPASKATLGQEGPSKAATIEDDSSETNESESGGDAGQYPSRLSWAPAQGSRAALQAQGGTVEHGRSKATDPRQIA